MEPAPGSRSLNHSAEVSAALRLARPPPPRKQRPQPTGNARDMRWTVFDTCDSAETIYVEAEEEADVVKVVRLQAFDGSFVSSPQLAALVGQAAMGDAKTHDVEEGIWATVVAIAWLQIHLKEQPDLLEGLVEKAREYVEQTPGQDFDELLQSAARFVG